MKKAASVDEYIKSAPIEVQARLHALRKAIKETVPNAEEKISYGIPFYHYNGRLAYFAYAKKHIGLYAITAPILDQYKKELEEYVKSKGTIQIPNNKPLPLGLIKKLIKSQAKLFTEKGEPKR